MIHQHLIHYDSAILSGKPIVIGTRISVEFILKLHKNGWTRIQIFESYPQLTEQALEAIFSYPSTKDMN